MAVHDRRPRAAVTLGVIPRVRRLGIACAAHGREGSRGASILSGHSSRPNACLVCLAVLLCDCIIPPTASTPRSTPILAPQRGQTLHEWCASEAEDLQHHAPWLQHPKQPCCYSRARTCVWHLLRRPETLPAHCLAAASRAVRGLACGVWGTCGLMHEHGLRMSGRAREG